MFLLCQRRVYIIIMVLGIIVTGCGAPSNPSVSKPVSTSLPTPTVAKITSGPTATSNLKAETDLKPYFQDYKGAFVLYYRNENQYTRYNPERCDERFLPASTFKIMNSLIGLETGVIPDENYVIQWDGVQYPISAWNQDHSMKTAFQNSVVWYYRELARRVGSEKMQKYIDLAEYGNQDISGPADLFWLAGGLRISADEQVELLKRLYGSDLPFSERSMRIVREIMVLDKNENYQLSGKTGSGQVGNTYIGWFVGYVEKNENVYFFAVNIENTKDDANGIKAKGIALDILSSLGILP
jgi:beta-lactamase class D